MLSNHLSQPHLSVPVTPNKSKRLILNTIIAALGSSVYANTLSAAEVNIYSARQPFLIAPILAAFTEHTGIVTNIIYTSSNLVERLKIEGERSVVDLILTSDVAPLYQLANLDLTQPVSSVILQQNIPESFRDPQQQWFGLTSRARIIYASKTRVTAADITDYEQLMDKKWRGRICSRSAKHNYMLSLIGSMLLAKGEQFTEQWLIAVKANLARKPQGNDRAQVKAISEGVCDIALVNTYYFGKMLTNKRKPEQIAWAKSVKLIFPNQKNRGSHMNISGIALAKNAPHKEHAIKLMEYLSGDEAQYTYAQNNHEFPVRKNTQHSKLLQQYMPEFIQDKASLAEIAKQRSRVLALIKRVGFDQ